MQGAIAEGWGEGAGLAASTNGSLRAYPHPSLRATFSRREKGKADLALPQGVGQR